MVGGQVGRGQVSLISHGGGGQLCFIINLDLY